MNDSYFTLDTIYEATFKDKGSKFIAFAHAVKNAEEAKSIVENYRKDTRFKGACHFCYAYKLGIDNYSRSSDDGEPSGTAGKPILNQIESFKLSDILVIVVRFFGGTLLGTSGLIHAYKQASHDCLMLVKPVEVVLRKKLGISFNYTLQSEIERLLKGFNIEFEDRKFDAQVHFVLQIKLSELELFKKNLREASFYNQLQTYE